MTNPQEMKHDELAQMTPMDDVEHQLWAVGQEVERLQISLERIRQIIKDAIDVAHSR